MICDGEFLESLTEKYDAYVGSFRGSDDVLPRMMELKRIHTAHVVENAKAVAAGENFDERTYFSAAAAALLHDAGRYEQLRSYNTFRDAESVDHAKFSYDIAREKGWLDDLEEKNDILDAVRVHNMRDIPEEVSRRPFAFTLSKIVRDSDKLDIFRVLEHEIAVSDWKKDCTAFWNLPVAADPNPAILDAIRNEEHVKYEDIKSLADFILVQVGWIRNELNFETTKRICRERKHLEFRRNFLHRISSDPAIDEVCGETA